MLDVSRLCRSSRSLAAAVLLLLALGPASAAAGPLMTGAGAGGGPHVRVFDMTGASSPSVSPDFFAFDPSFTGGVRVATGGPQRRRRAGPDRWAPARAAGPTSRSSTD